MLKRLGKISILCAILLNAISLSAQSESKQVKRLSDKVSQQNTRINELETKLNILLPELQRTLKATVEAKNRQILSQS